MKKTLIAVFAATLLLAVVICTAGCVTAPADPFIGTWYSEISDTETGILIVSENNTGTSAIVKNIASGSGEPEYQAVANDTIKWMKNTDGTYSVTYSDGTIYTITLDPNNDKFTGNDEYGTVFMRFPSGLSGLTGLNDIAKQVSAVQKATNVLGY